MKEYCNHCAPKFGTTNSFIGITKLGKFAHVVCAGCGVTYVNHLGECQKCNYRKKFNYESLAIWIFLVLVSIIACSILYISY